MGFTSPPFKFGTLAAALHLALASTAALAQAPTPPPSTAAPAAPVKVETVVIESNQGNMRPGALRDEIVKTESFSEKAIARSGATNIPPGHA